jgi:hypothetical protein
MTKNIGKIGLKTSFWFKIIGLKAVKSWLEK